MCNMIKWSDLPWNHFILSLITFSLLYSCNLVLFLVSLDVQFVTFI